MTAAIDRNTVTILTAANSATELEILRLPTDMHDEASEALESGRESAVEYCCVGLPDEQSTHYIYFPEAGRGAVCNGGGSVWTDCSGLDDLADRWANYEERWSD